MALKTVLETLDGVDDAIAKLYTEKDDTFVLDIEDIDNHPDVRSVVNANKTNAKKAKDRQARIEALEAQVSTLPEDFDHDTWEKVKSGTADDAAVEAAVAKVRKQSDARIQAAEAERDEWKGKHDTIFSENRATQAKTLVGDALSKAGVTVPEFVEGARALLMPKVAFGDDGNPFVETDMGEVKVEEFIAKWAKTDGKPYVSPPKGGDAPGGDKRNGLDPNSNNPLASRVPGFSELPAS